MPGSRSPTIRFSACVCILEGGPRVESQGARLQEIWLMLGLLTQHQQSGTPSAALCNPLGRHPRTALR